MEMPVCMNGTVKSTAASLSVLIFSADMTMSVFWCTRDPISPFHFPFCQQEKKKTRIYPSSVLNSDRLERTGSGHLYFYQRITGTIHHMKVSLDHYIPGNVNYRVRIWNKLD
jgi:hypothetical protein